MQANGLGFSFQIECYFVVFGIVAPDGIQRLAIADTLIAFQITAIQRVQQVPQEVDNPRQL